MKIDIITLSCAMNYGAVLQTYGLYAFMEDNGFTTEVIDYIPRHYNFDAPDYTDKYLEHTRLWKKNFVLRYIWKKIVFSKIFKFFYLCRPEPPAGNSTLYYAAHKRALLT